jgi:hypothetical protein
MAGIVGGAALAMSMLSLAAAKVPHDAWPPILLIVPLFVAVVVVHELGHLVAAAASGGTILGMGIGPLWIWRRRRGVRLAWRAALHGTSGLALAVPASHRGIPRQMIVFAAGGPLANMICAAIMLPLAWPRIGHPHGVWQAAGFAFAVQSLAVGILNLLPIGKSQSTDGSLIAAWWRGGAEMETSARALAMYDYSLRGMLASEMPVEAVASLESNKVVGVRFFGRYIALRAAQQLGDRTAFEAILGRCREEVTGMSPETYDSLRGIWAYFVLEEAFERACAGSPTVPEVDPSWLRRISPTSYLRLEAANALAMNDASLFESKVAKARAELDGEFDAATRRAEALLLDRLEVLHRSC